MKKHNSGFTLVELLLVIGIIATLAVVAFVALDPAKRFADARDVRRISDVETILSAVHQYVVDSKGSFPDSLSDVNTEKQIGTASSGCSINTGNCGADSACADLGSELEKYLKTIPYDPENGSAATTHYTIEKNNDGIITIRACDYEGDAISVSR